MRCGQSVQLLNVKLVVHHVTGRFWKFNGSWRAQIIKYTHLMFCVGCHSGHKVCSTHNLYSSLRSKSFDDSHIQSYTQVQLQDVPKITHLSQNHFVSLLISVKIKYMSGSYYNLFCVKVEFLRGFIQVYLV